MSRLELWENVHVNMNVNMNMATWMQLHARCHTHIKGGRSLINRSDHRLLFCLSIHSKNLSFPSLSRPRRDPQDSEYHTTSTTLGIVSRRHRSVSSSIPYLQNTENQRLGDREAMRAASCEMSFHCRTIRESYKRPTIYC